MSPAKSQKKNRRRKQVQTPKRLEGLRRKLDQGPFRGYKLIAGPTDEAKMSDVLADFVAPYVVAAHSEDAYHKLLTLAVLAWNAALLTEDQQQQMIDDVLIQGLGAAPESLKMELREFVGALIVRKKALFPDNQRAIIEFEIQNSGKGYHLSVVSTLPAPHIGGSGKERPGS